MDEKLEKALKFSNYVATFENQKRILFENYKQNLVLYKNGGKFSVTEQRINYLQTLCIQNHKDCVITDDNNLPVRFDNTEELLKEMLEISQEAILRYESAYNDLKNKRSIDKLVGLDD